MKKYLLSFLLNLVVLFFGAHICYASEPIGAWSSTTNLPYTEASHTSQVYGGKVILLGGATNDQVDNPLYANINTNGTLQSWIPSSNTPPPKYLQSSVRKDNIVYLLGGSTFPDHYYNTVYMAKLDDSGEISAWQELNSLPESSALGASVIVGNKLYYATGFKEGTQISQNIYWATINSDGTIGNWNNAGQYPESSFGFAMIASVPFVFILA